MPPIPMLGIRSAMEFDQQTVCCSRFRYETVSLPDPVRRYGDLVPSPVDIEPSSHELIFWFFAR